MLLQIAQNVFKRRLTSAIALPIALLLLLSGISLWQVSHLLRAMQWVEHTNQVIAQAYQTQKLLLDLQTGVRGYLLTKERAFLEPYQQASLVINTAFEDLKQLVSDNPSQVQRVNQLEVQYQELKRLMVLALERYQQGKVEPLSAFWVRKQKMDAIRRQIATFIATEEKLRTQRSQVVRRTTQQVVVNSIILSLVIGLILAYFIREQLLKLSQNYENALRTAIEQTDNAQRSAQRLADLHEIDRAILAAKPNVTIIKNALGCLRQIVNCQLAFVVLFNFETGTVQLIANSADEELQLLEGTVLSIEHFAPIEVIQQIKIHSIQDISYFEQCPPILERMLAAGLLSCLTIPIRDQEILIGELTLVSTQTETFNIETQQIVNEVAAQLAIAIQQSKLRKQLYDYAEELEQRVAERTAELQEVNQELEAFNYSVSHDLRAPLRTMQGFAQALLEDYSDQIDATGQDYIRYISDGSMQMDTLITDLLAYGRLSRAQIQIQPTDLNVVVNEALKQLGTQIQEQQAEVIIDTLGQVMAHRPTLVQVVTNLLSNAIKFVTSDVKPFVHIYSQEYVHEGKSWIRLWFVDNGIGIAPEHQERIFRVFERLHGVEIYPGTGIGLAIVRKGLERMGGSFGVESQLGKGSHFWIALPKAVLNYNATTDESNTPLFDNR